MAPQARGLIGTAIPIRPLRYLESFEDAEQSWETAMRISARNQIKGTVVDVTKGATTSHIRVDIGNGQIVTSSITNEAVEDLGIKAKGHVTVVIKASDVMIAVD